MCSVTKQYIYLLEGEKVFKFRYTTDCRFKKKNMSSESRIVQDIIYTKEYTYILDNYNVSISF